MLKVTFLTCAIIATQPLMEDARAGEAVRGSLSVVWTGRFVDMARAPVLASTGAKTDSKPPGRVDGGGDPDIVGSIPPSPAVDSARDILLLRGAQTMSLCMLPGLTSDPAGEDLACGGAQHNRWSAKARAFNYDLSAVKPDFANAPAPYTGSWDAKSAPSQ